MNDFGWQGVVAITVIWSVIKITAFFFLPIRCRKRLIAWAKHWTQATCFVVARMA